MMANYYEKLTKIFLMSGNALFHAAAWGSYYSSPTLVASQRKNSDDSLAKYSSALWQYLLVSTQKKPLRRARERMLD